MSTERPEHVLIPGASWTYTASLEVRDDGSVVLPPELARRFGIIPGALVRIEEHDHHILLHRPASHLNEIYIEPTTHCPFGCATCIRHAWTEPLGRMSERVFGRILEGLNQFNPIPSVFFGGFGEPLSHPGILDMVRRVKESGARVELITNGLLLDEECIRQLIALKLDSLWVSLDGATPECYGEVREDGVLEKITANLHLLNAVKWGERSSKPVLGIAFVAMKRNQSELRKVVALGLRVGAARFSVSNLLPHSELLQKQILYEKSLGQDLCDFSRFDLPRMDGGGEWDHDVAKVLADCGLRFEHGRASSQVGNECPFVRKGSMSIRWDGQASPCLPLLHSHTEYLQWRQRQVEECTFGSVTDLTLPEIWELPPYLALRQRLQRFDFPPCVRCNSCDLVESNQQDCFRNQAPVCGACLWAQGYILCP